MSPSLAARPPVPAITMDMLIATFHRSVAVDHENGSPFLLAISECGGVIAHEHIPVGSCIGELAGTPCYIWDIHHTEYIIVGEDMVLDLAHTRRTVLSFVREENETSSPCNCRVAIESDVHMSKHRCFVYALRAIQPGEELVYAVDPYTY